MIFTVQRFCEHVFYFNKNGIMLHKTVFKKYMIFFCENNSPPLRSHSISKRNAMDHRKSLLGLFFYLNPQRLIFFFWNVLYHCTWSQGQVRLSLTFRFSSAERHSLPHVTLSVACYSWPWTRNVLIYILLHFIGLFVSIKWREIC